MDVGATVRYRRVTGTVGVGVVIEVIPNHWLTGRTAYWVQGGAENPVIHDWQIEDTA